MHVCVGEQRYIYVHRGPIVCVGGGTGACVWGVGEGEEGEWRFLHVVRGMGEALGVAGGRGG